MRKLLAAFAGVLCVLAFAGTAGAGVNVGVNDDAGKYADGASQFWTTMQSVGLKQNAMTVLWDETRPTTIVDQSFIAHSLPAAQAAGIKVVFDVYPMHSQALTSDPSNIQKFAAFVGQLAQTFPQVTEYVVMNECNQPRFINPQFSGTTADAANASAAVCGQALAAAYDALKAVNPSIFVWGVGLSPRGNDDPTAPSNISTSPVKFLGYLGQWYRQSGRTKPIMDGLDFHPYPVPQSLPFAQGYQDTDNASVSNLPRIYQAFYDAFKGTAQPTIGQQAGGGLPISLNEVGIQTDATGHAGYTGSEASANANGGVLPGTDEESFQANWYLQMLNLVACDPNVKVVNIFHLVDESDLAAWQSGLYWVGYQPKQSANVVQQWISQTGGNCTGATQSWTPSDLTPTGGTGSTGGTAGVAALQAKLASVTRQIATLKKTIARTKSKTAKAKLAKQLATLVRQQATLKAQILTASSGGSNPGKGKGKGKGTTPGSGTNPGKGKGTKGVKSAPPGKGRGK